MSKKSWEKEFYPVEADSKEAMARPIAYSLKKWRGLTPENLARHNLTESPIEISGDTCALCQTFDKGGSTQCRRCPLYRARGGVPCDATTSEEHNEDRKSVV